MELSVKIFLPKSLLESTLENIECAQQAIREQDRGHPDLRALARVWLRVHETKGSKIHWRGKNDVA